MPDISKLRFCFVTISVTWSLISCSSSMTPTGPDQHESRSVELDKSERVRVQLKLPVGELDARGGSAKLLEGDFTYNVPAWKPDIQYRAAAGAGDLVLEQHGSTSSTGNTKNQWDLRLNNEVPLDMKVEVGAGEARLKLGSLTLSSLDIEMGAGTLNLDLRGAPKKDYSVRVRGGVGDATIHLPRDIGISATASGGIGEVSVRGLHKNGDRYVNDAYERAAVRIRLDIQGGVGSIKLVAE